LRDRVAVHSKFESNPREGQLTYGAASERFFNGFKRDAAPPPGS
jgi:hypothetical protein